MWFRVEGDVHGIAKRLREVDEAYTVFWNNAVARFEVHTGADPSARTLAFIVPYEELDARAVEYAWRTRRENFDEIEREIELNNEEVRVSAVREFGKQKRVLRDKLEFAERVGRDVAFGKGKGWF
jgi:hypothetical protein